MKPILNSGDIIEVDGNLYRAIYSKKGCRACEQLDSDDPVCKREDFPYVCRSSVILTEQSRRDLLKVELHEPCTDESCYISIVKQQCYGYHFYPEGAGTFQYGNVILRSVVAPEKSNLYIKDGKLVWDLPSFAPSTYKVAAGKIPQKYGVMYRWLPPLMAAIHEYRMKFKPEI